MAQDALSSAPRPRRSRSWRGRGPVLAGARVLLLAVALGALESAVKMHLVNSFFVPPPSQVAQRLADDLRDPAIWRQIAITLGETGVAFVIAAAVGLGFGYLLWRSHLLGEAFDPILAGIFSSPIILLYPIFLVVFGRNERAVVGEAVAYGILPIALLTRQALGGVNPTFLKLARSLDLPPAGTFRHIQLPAAAPGIFTGLRLGLTYILISVIAMEFIAQIGGLGHYVAESALRFQTASTYSGIALVVLVAVLFIYLTDQLERRAAR